MLELTAARKQKVNLADYSSAQDIANRILLSDLSAFELEVIEEILFSPLKISLAKLARNMESSEEELTPLLQKLSRTELLSLDGDQIQVDKERRKYFEFEITRFDPSFKPDLEFIQGILRKVPIHVLPIWYALPRTSNNIFESIVEKYLLTPQIFLRYLADLHFATPAIEEIAKALFQAKEYKLYSSDLIAKYNLTRLQFEEISLLLEFHFVGYLSYEKEEEHWVEVITPFYEWQQYLLFLKETETQAIGDQVEKEHASDFAFVEEIERVLLLASQGIELANLLVNALTSRALAKIQLLQLAKIEEGAILLLEGAAQWLGKSAETQALYLYRHPLNLAALSSNERLIREGEKAIRRVLHGGWVLFEEFFKGVTVSLADGAHLMMRKVGKQYRYAPPLHGEQEKRWLKTLLFEWLFEAGMVAPGKLITGEATKECFYVTPFGRFCFEE